jgi:hypothetical protein
VESVGDGDVVFSDGYKNGGEGDEGVGGYVACKLSGWTLGAGWRCG